MPTGAASPRQPTAEVRYRRRVAPSSSPQMADLRQAFRAVMGISDERGYHHHAGLHGLPLPIYCEHGTPLFLPWHRAYLYFFELALRDQVPGVTLSWWDWTSAASHTEGLPGAFSEEEVDGEPNPLYSAEVDPVALEQARRAGIDVPPVTERQPGDPSELPTAEEMESVLSLADFTDFSDQLEDPHHNFIHVWTGGHMSQVPFAAYDPIFWAHHTMVDRLWRLWQLRHPGSGPPAELLGQALPPFNMTVAETLDVTALGYDYASSTTYVSVED